MSNDPFDRLTTPDEPVRPDSRFATDLRDRIATALGLTETDTDTQPTIRFQTGRPAMSTTAHPTTTAAGAPVAAAVTPYLSARDAVAALDFYIEVFGAVEAIRVMGDDGRVGHAEFSIGSARVYLADEYPEIGVSSPQTLGGTSVTLHVEVSDVDALFARAVAAGAQSLGDPADQPHGARHGTLVDPFGHRWMLSQQVETFDVAEYARRSEGTGFTVVAPDPPDDPRRAASGQGGIWAAVNATDAPAMIRLMVDVFGFTEQLVVPGDAPNVVVHSQLRWPEGGIVQVGSAGREHPPYSQRPTGADSLYVITADPMAVYERCTAAGMEVIDEPSAPDYDPGGTVFSVRDPEGNIWSFGTYAGES